MPLQAATPRSLVDQAIDGMRALLLAGEWSVGDRVPAEPVLAAELGVSRNTVREAVKALAHAGVLEVRRGDGTYVAAPNEVSALIRRQLSRVEQGHVLEVRHAIETHAATLAAARRTDADLAVLADALDRRSAAVAGGDADGFASADCDFHLAMVAAAHNPLLSELYGGFVETLMASVVLPPGDADDLAATTCRRRARSTPRRSGAARSSGPGLRSFVRRRPRWPISTRPRLGSMLSVCGLRPGRGRPGASSRPRSGSSASWPHR